MEISKHPEMGNIIGSIRKICQDHPCENCTHLKDDLNAAKSREKHWKDKYDEIIEINEKLSILRDLMRQICGGSFPIDINDFNFESADEWVLINDHWVPHSQGEVIAEGPKLAFNIKIVTPKSNSIDDK